MKKIMFLCVIVMSLVVFSCGKKSSPVSWFEFRVDKGQATVKGLTKEGKEQTKISIPAKYNGFPVTEISDYAFEKCDLLTSVSIPSSVTKIGNWAFFRCSLLKSVNIPDSVEEIGHKAFSECGLEKVSISSNTILRDYQNGYGRPLEPPFDENVVITKR